MEARGCRDLARSKPVPFSILLRVRDFVLIFMFGAEGEVFIFKKEKF